MTSETLPSVRADFFGKDRFVPFIGVVEDVNDPKHGNRVKVRCIGWHPKEKTGEGEVKTEDLPWARVGMPATYPQQGRVGGKHGLLPGCWVFGCFLDGDEAQQPFVITTFGFTPKASDKSTRVEDKDTEGTQSEDVEAFAKTNPNANFPNAALNTDKESQGQTSHPEDPDGDLGALDESDSECGGKAANKSVANKRMHDEELKNEEKSNPEAQNYDVSNGDGQCGAIPHSRTDIQKKIKERMPSESSRFVYGDVVWNMFEGNYIDMNGLLMKMALEICNLMKHSFQSGKAFTEDTINRTIKSKLLLIPDRDGVTTQESDQTTTTKDDFFHAIFGTSTIDLLCQIVMQALQQMNNGGGGEGGNNSGGNIGTNPNTPIEDWEAWCLTDSFLATMEDIMNNALQSALDAANAAVSGGVGILEGSEASKVLSILGGLSSVMSFPSLQKFTIFTDVLNHAGPLSQDVLTKGLGDGAAGCIPERIYNTAKGALSAISTSGGSSANPGNPGSPDWGKIGFGGLPPEYNINPGISVCEDARTGKEPDDDGSGELPNLGQDPTDIGGGFTDIIPGGDGGTIIRGPGVEIIIPPGGPVPELGPGGELIFDDPDPFAGIGIDPGRDKDIGIEGLGDGFQGIGIERGINRVPSGEGAAAVAIGLPSEDPVCAQNFVNGIPNSIVILNRGGRYYFRNQLSPEKCFPAVYINGYDGSPIPVVDKNTGELFAILSTCALWNFRTPNPPVTLISSSEERGITTDQTDEFDFVLGGFHVQNTGFLYKDPVVRVIDRDTEEENGEVKATVIDGRIVNLEIINNGSGFKRIPKLFIEDAKKTPGIQSGWGAKVYPIMNVIPKSTSKGDPDPIQTIFCPSKNQKNLY